MERIHLMDEQRRIEQAEAREEARRADQAKLRRGSTQFQAAPGGGTRGQASHSEAALLLLK